MSNGGHAAYEEVVDLMAFEGRQMRSMSSGGCSTVIELDAIAGCAIGFHFGQPREDGFLAVESAAVAGDRHVVSGRRPRRPNTGDELLP